MPPSPWPDVAARAIWVASGAAVLVLAWCLTDSTPWLVNLLIPAGAWIALRGLA
jgi:hypothetical protein